MNQARSTIEANLAASAVHRSRIAVWAMRQVDGVSSYRRYHGVVTAIADGKVWVRDGERTAAFDLDEILACDPVPTLAPRPMSNGGQ